MGQFLALILIALASFASVRAEDLMVVPMLNQFGAQPTPAPHEPTYQKLDEFMRGARRGGTLKLAFSEGFISIFPTPIRGGDFRPRAPLAPDFLFETLMTLDPRQDDYSLYPLILRELRGSADLCRIHVELRDDVRFSDGTPLRTRDVHVSLDKYTGEFFSGAMADLIHRTMGKVEMTDGDDLNFDVRFTEIDANRCRQAAYFFLNGVPLLKPNPEARPGAEVDAPYIGSGPYRVTAAGRTLIRYARNPEYWANAHPRRVRTFNPETIEIRAYLDPILERFAFLRGEINLMRETKFTYDAWMKKQTARFPIHRLDQKSDELGVEVGAVWMNQAHEHTANIDFRRALLLVWDVAHANRDFYADRRHALPAPGRQSRLYPRGRPSTAVLELLKPAAEDPNFAGALGEVADLNYERLNRPASERQRLRLALAWLEHAGYTYARRGGRTVMVKDGRPVRLTAIVRLGSPELKLFLRFQNQLRLLGIELNLKEFGDRTALVAALQANQYDLFPSGVSIARDFSIINSSYLIMELHSSGANGLGAWGRVKSKLLDVTIDELGKRTPADADYPIAVEAFLRAFNANVPVLLSGEVDPVVTFHYDDVRVWENRDRDLWTLYFKGAN